MEEKFVLFPSQSLDTVFHRILFGEIWVLVKVLLHQASMIHSYLISWGCNPCLELGLLRNLSNLTRAISPATSQHWRWCSVFTDPYLTILVAMLVLNQKCNYFLLPWCLVRMSLSSCNVASVRSPRGSKWVLLTRNPSLCITATNLCCLQTQNSRHSYKLEALSFCQNTLGPAYDVFTLPDSDSYTDSENMQKSYTGTNSDAKVAMKITLKKFTSSVPISVSNWVQYLSAPEYKTE